jgi:hypothetical protein
VEFFFRNPRGNANPVKRVDQVLLGGKQFAGDGHGDAAVEGSELDFAEGYDSLDLDQLAVSSTFHRCSIVLSEN